MIFSDKKEAVSYLDRFQFHGFRLGLERVEAALKALGNPQEAYPCIHVAGTNGKGSVCAAIATILLKAGVRVGFYSSPHLVELNERFRINLEPVDDHFLRFLIEETASLVEKGYELSYFEFTTAMAFSCFRHEHVDLAVIETGLGGRLDATNVIKPTLSIITNISLDHQSYLGSTEEEIAREKAGIIKEGVPVVAGTISRGPLEVIQGVAKSKGCELKILGRDYRVENSSSGNRFDFISEDLTLKGLRFGLRGPFQIDNAAVSLQACCKLRSLGYNIKDEDLYWGLLNTRWPGRSELLKGDLLVLLEGAHNQAGIIGLLKELKELEKELSVSNKILLWACSNEGGDKDPLKMLKTISPLFQKIFITEPRGPRKPVTVKEWKELTLPKRAVLKKDYKKALKEIVSRFKGDNLLVVAGSLYLVGPTRSYLRSLGFKDQELNRWNL